MAVLHGASITHAIQAICGNIVYQNALGDDERDDVRKVTSLMDPSDGGI